MIFWIKTRDGCVRLSDRWQNYLYVAGNLHDLATLSRRLRLGEDVTCDEKRFQLQDKTSSPLLKIPISNPRHALNLAEAIARLGDYELFQLYNVDVPPEQMYLYEKQLFPLAYIEARNEGHHIKWSVNDSVERNNYTIPSFTSIKLDVRTTSSTIPHFNDPIQRIELHNHDETISIDSGDETDKLLKFCKTFRELDPDIVFTRGGNTFLFPYLLRRALENRIHEEFILGRENLPLRSTPGSGSTYFSYGRVCYRPKPIRLSGHIHIDLDTSFLYHSCGLEGLIEVSRVCRTPLQKTVNSTIGTIMTSLQMYHAIKKGVLVPWEKTQIEDFKTAKELLLADRGGGFIYEPRIGVHDDVGEIDFQSLYPMLMMKHNLSPECVSCDCCPDSPYRVPELNTNICQKRRGLIPHVLNLLIEKRLAYKRMRNEAHEDQLKKKYDQRQSALKWVMVTCFGYLGFRNARFGKIDAHIATCAFARDALIKAARIAEEDGFEVIHGIVDSLWLKKPQTTASDFLELCRIIQKKLDLPLSFKGKYRWIIFSSSKTRTCNPVLNRYFGAFENGEIKARGIELQRRDTPKLIKDFQTEMLHFMAKASNSQELKNLIPETENIIAKYIRRISSKDLSVKDLTIQKYLSKNPSDYTKNVPQAIAAQQLLRERVMISAGQPVHYVITDADNPVPALRVIPLELVKNPLCYDTRKYIELFTSSANTLLHPLGYTVKGSIVQMMEKESAKTQCEFFSY